MVQNHARWSPGSCSCVIDILVDDVTGDQTLFAIKNICNAHKGIATADPDFETKKQAALTKRYQDLDDNLARNYTQIDAYTDLQMSPADKAACRAIQERITIERKEEYERLLSTQTNPNANLSFCVNVHDGVKEENDRYMKVFNRLQNYLNYTDAQMKTLIKNTTWSYSGIAPNRLFTVNFGSQLTTQQKNTIQTWCDTNVGVGRVTIL